MDRVTSEKTRGGRERPPRVFSGKGTGAGTAGALGG